MSTRSKDLRTQLESMSRAELDVLARQMSVSGFRQLKKPELIDEILLDEKQLCKYLKRSVWDQYHNHIYGALGIGLAVVGIIITVLYTASPASSDEFKNLREREVQQQVVKILESDPEIIYEDRIYREPVDEILKPDYEGFELIEESHVWDLRDWKKVEDVDRNKTISPAVLKTELRLRRSAEATTYQILALTSGYDVYSRCDSHPKGFKVLHTRDEKRVVSGKNTLMPRLLEIDLSDEPIDRDIHITTTRTYWNAIQSSEQSWIGTIVRQRILKISFLVILPENKQFSDFKLQVSKVGSDHTFRYTGQEVILVDPMKQYIFWEIVNPEVDHLYRVDWDW